MFNRKNNLNEISEIIDRGAKISFDLLISNKDLYKQEIKKVFNKKLLRVNNNIDLYIESLIRNDIYYSNVIPNVHAMYRQMLIDKSNLSSDEIKIKILGIQEYFRVPGYCYTKEDHDHIKDYKNMSLETRKSTLEYDYMYYYTYAEILYDLIIYLNDKKNKRKLEKKDAKEVMQVIEGVVRYYTTLIVR